MSYAELIQAYFERSVALQWYWTVYVLVIGGVLGFTTLRQRPDLVTTIAVTILFACFAFKNVGAIEATAEEREAIRAAFKQQSATGPRAVDIQLVRDKVEPTLSEYDIPGARYFHIACAVITIVYLWAKEMRRHVHARAESRAK
jgi:hypothetical protein